MPTEASKSRNREFISLVDDDEPDNVAKLRTEIAELVNERANLKSSLYGIECDNTDLKLQLREKDSVLKDTQAMLGQYVVASNRPVQGDSVPGPSRRPESSLKRARSPSLEIVDMSEPPRKKGKEKESYSVATPVVTPAGSMARSRSRAIPFVSVPPRKTGIVVTPVKSETTSRPQASTSKLVKLSPSEEKHRKIEPEPKDHEFVPATQSPIDDASGRGNRDSPIPVASSSKRSSRPSPPSSNSNVTSEQENPSLTKDKAKFTVTSSSIDFSTSSSELDKPKLRPLPMNPRFKEDKAKPNIKVKDVFNLPASTVRHYLQSAEALTITPPPIGLEVPRKFLRLAYGGSDMQLLQYIQEDMNPSGPVQRRIIFPTLDLNPAMPSAPGEPGLVFASRHEILSNPPWTLFCKHSKSTPVVWSYLGEYENVLCEKMSAEQFKSQSPVTKKKWAQRLLETRTVDAYVGMRSRIALRVAGTIPVEDKELEEELIQVEMRAVKSDQGQPVTEANIITAFSNGDEGIDIIRMTCVKYDHIFANDMKAKYANYDILLAADERKKAEGKEKSKAKPKKAGGSKKKDASNLPPQKRGRKSKASTLTKAIDVDEEEDEGERDRGGEPDEEHAATLVSSGHELRPRRTARQTTAWVIEDHSSGEAFMDDDDDD